MKIKGKGIWRNDAYLSDDQIMGFVWRHPDTLEAIAYTVGNRVDGDYDRTSCGIFQPGQMAEARQAVEAAVLKDFKRFVEVVE